MLPRPRHSSTAVALLLGLTGTLATSTARAAEAGGVAPLLEEYLVAGDTAGAEKRFTAWVADAPKDDEARYALGIVKVLRGVENLGRNMHRYGLQPQERGLPFVRMPVPPNPTPETITYEKWRGIFETFVEDMDAASEVLGAIEDPSVKIKVPVGMVRLDLDGDGEATDAETFWKVFTTVAWRAAKLDEDQKRFEIGFDRADVHWLNGYTHLLRALAEIMLAHDSEEFFNMLAPQFFAGAEVPGTKLDSGQDGGFLDPDRLADLIAAIHLAKFEVVEPKRMAAAHGHLLSMVKESRQCWEHALVETDDDREWIPNARQTSLTPLTVTNERILAWKRFLDEMEAVLEGDRLIPHWRVPQGVGIDLKRVFLEPRTLDVVMWVHGGAAVPYLEEGDTVTRETARTFNAAFQGRFLAFAVWFQ